MLDYQTLLFSILDKLSRMDLIRGFWGFGVLGFWGFGVLGFWGFGVYGLLLLLYLRMACYLMALLGKILILLMSLLI